MSSDTSPLDVQPEGQHQARGVFAPWTDDRPRAPSSYDDQYVLGPDSQRHPNVPLGQVFEFVLSRSEIFPGTTRTVSVYVPAQYRAECPACVYVSLDGLILEAPTVFDNLIHNGEMPVTIGIGLSPGIVPSASASENPRFNRSVEFDSLNSNLACFLLGEVLPEVESRRTPSGLPILLSKSANDRAIGGVSSGAAGAFTAAWERPDAFRRVFLALGTFVGMRGADRYAVLVRKTEPKPIRVFMQDGANDQLTDRIGEAGDWWLSNQTMLGALEFAGYPVRYVWGKGSHNLRHPAAVFPDAMRWLWKGWPEGVVAGHSRNVVLREVLREAEGWQPVPGACCAGAAIASNSRGDLMFSDAVGDEGWQLSEGGLSRGHAALGKHCVSVAFGP